MQWEVGILITIMELKLGPFITRHLESCEKLLRLFLIHSKKSYARRSQVCSLAPDSAPLSVACSGEPGTIEQRKMIGQRQYVTHMVYKTVAHVPNLRACVRNERHTTAADRLRDNKRVPLLDARNTNISLRASDQRRHFLMPRILTLGCDNILGKLSSIAWIESPAIETCHGHWPLSEAMHLEQSEALSSPHIRPQTKRTTLRRPALRWVRGRTDLDRNHTHAVRALRGENSGVRMSAQRSRRGKVNGCPSVRTPVLQYPALASRKSVRGRAAR